MPTPKNEAKAFAAYLHKVAADTLTELESKADKAEQLKEKRRRMAGVLSCGNEKGGLGAWLAGGCDERKDRQ